VWNTRWTFRGRAKHNLRQTVLFVFQVLLNIAVGNALFFVLIRPLLIYTDISTYLVGNVAKIISVLVASSLSFFVMRYLVFTRKRRLGGRL